MHVLIDIIYLSHALNVLCDDLAPTAAAMSDAMKGVIKESTLLKADLVKATNAGVNLVLNGWAPLTQVVNLMFQWGWESFGQYAHTPKAARAPGRMPAKVAIPRVPFSDSMRHD